MFFKKSKNNPVLIESKEYLENRIKIYNRVITRTINCKYYSNSTRDMIIKKCEFGIRECVTKLVKYEDCVAS